MNLAAINKSCFAVCLGCIALGTGLGLVIIWTDIDAMWAGKAWLTIGGIFLAAVLTLSVSKLVTDAEVKK